MNSQFSSVFTTDDGTVPILTQRTDAQLSTFDISPERVRKFMCKLPAKFSRSPDGIPAAVLKILSYELCIPLHIIFKMSLDSTTCPTARSFRLDIARNHFCNRVVPLWNSLPAHVVNKPSPKLFKAALRNIDFTHAVKFTRNL